MPYLKKLIRQKDFRTNRLRREFIRLEFGKYLNYATYLLSDKKLSHMYKLIEWELKRLKRNNTVYEKNKFKQK